MSELISREEVSVEVDFYGIYLQDWDDSQVPVPFPEGWEAGPFLRARPGRLDITSAGHTHTAALTVEVWDAEPPAPSGDWEESERAEILSISGELEVGGVAGGPMPEPIRLSGRECNWSVRVACSGRSEVAEKARQGVPEGVVERYVLQFWPQV
ncbi:hypothetical protein GPA10_24215 [Streptomyces sp. p1417]|uniref:Uncharacterized protein n=1 Tax=Streptomyces typhae TaxID=2681492 RepID=A0A6L6X2B5_9ACTN|nr:hypothetical protein [Streptomyces typhae]MVO87780.1 hypothetical protein [Streptomyces typhae]